MDELQESAKNNLLEVRNGAIFQRCPFILHLQGVGMSNIFLPHLHLESTVKLLQDMFVVMCNSILICHQVGRILVLLLSLVARLEVLKTGIHLRY